MSQPPTPASLMARAYIPPSATDNWATPQDLFDALHRKFRFTVDVAASPENAKLSRFYTVAEDGLSQDWSNERVWCNPPYGRAIADWMRKAYESSRMGATVVLLVPSRTDTGWWHDYAQKGRIRFLRGRLRFGGAKNAAPFPNALVIFRPRRRRLKKAA